MSEFIKKQRSVRRDEEKCEIDDFCTVNKIEKEHITEFQIRLYGKKIIDVYPTGRKYCIIYANKWGKYEDIKDLLKELL